MSLIVAGLSRGLVSTGSKAQSTPVGTSKLRDGFDHAGFRGLAVKDEACPFSVGRIEILIVTITNHLVKATG